MHKVATHCRRSILEKGSSVTGMVNVTFIAITNNLSSATVGNNRHYVDVCY